LWHNAPKKLPAGDQDEVDCLVCRSICSNSFWSPAGNFFGALYHKL